MLSRYYNTVHTPVLDLFDALKLFNEVDSTQLQSRFDTIDEEGIKIELPGVMPDDIDVNLDGKLLKVSGKTRHGKEFSYSYSLKSNVDDAAIVASLKNGLLSISLPKKQETTLRKIQVIS